MENRKAALIIIIIMLAISIPCSIIGIGYKIYLANKPSPVIPSKPNQDFYQNGTLNFYDYGELLGQYVCKNPNGYCGWAYETVDDEEYNLKYYKDNSIDNVTLISSRFAFLLDEEEISDSYIDKDIILYDVIDSKEVGTYKGVKDYTVGINNSYYIVKDANGKWGVIQLTRDGLTDVIPFEYDYIGLQNDLNPSTNKVIANVFVVLKNNEWFIVDLNNTKLSKPLIHSIMNYNKDSIIVNYYSRESLFDFNGTMQLNGQTYSHIEYIKNYVGYIDSEGNFSVVDYNNNVNVTKDSYPVASSSDIELINNEDGSIDIFISGEFKETIQ
ncbi:MAG: hypothetical protein ACI31M_04345 [Bacilli bacterium]